jgi:hypothetical protein
MARVIATVAALALLASGVPAQDKKADRIKELEAEIAKLESQLAKARQELDLLRPRRKIPAGCIPNLETESWTATPWTATPSLSPASGRSPAP